MDELERFRREQLDFVNNRLHIREEKERQRKQQHKEHKMIAKMAAVQLE